MKPKLLLLISVFVIASVLVAVVSVSALAGISLDWWSVDGGSAVSSEGRGYRLDGSIGQPDGGVSRGGNYALYGGFWGGGETATHDLIHLFLPLVLH